MANASPGSAHTVSVSVWSNNEVFLKYLQEHFLKHAVKAPGQQLFHFFDGYKSHICSAVQEWAKNTDVVLFLLLPHTSPKLQPVDISCFGPLKAKYRKV